MTGSRKLLGRAWSFCFFAAPMAGGLLAATFDAAADSVLDLSQPVSISCDTSAVKLDTSPFGASQGTIVINVRLDDDTDSKGPGRWKLLEIASEHDASFIGKTRDNCQPDCPMTQGKDGMLQLWSPKPLALNQLADGTALTLVTIDAKSLELKASTFQNKELAGLERGECKVRAPEEAKETAAEKEADADKEPGEIAPGTQGETNNP